MGIFKLLDVFRNSFPLIPPRLFRFKKPVTKKSRKIICGDHFFITSDDLKKLKKEIIEAIFKKLEKDFSENQDIKRYNLLKPLKLYKKKSMGYPMKGFFNKF